MTDKTILMVCTTDSMIYNFLVPHIRLLQNNGNRVICACSRTGFYFDTLENREQIEVIEVPFQRSPYRKENITAFRMLEKLVAQYGVNFIFCHEPVGGAMGRLIAWKHHIPVMYCAHGFHFFQGAALVNWIVYYSVEKILSYKTDYLLTINKEDYQRALKCFHAKKTYLLPGIGIDTARFQHSKGDAVGSDPALEVGNGKKIILSVGELSTRKNHIELLQALRLISEKNYLCMIVGEGDQEDYLKKYIQEYGLMDRVKLLGYRKDIDQLNAICDLFVFPSKQEGLPVAVMETMAAGNCVIASDVRGNRDLIDVGKGGWLYTLGDIEMLAKYIDDVLKNDTLRNEQGKYNSIKVQDFSLQNVLKQMQLIFDSVE